MSIKQRDLPDGTRIIELDPGRAVNCDYCNKDFTDLPDSGGILVGSYAVGPCCTPQALKDAKERFIKSRCPEGKSFANWVRQDLR